MTPTIGRIVHYYACTDEGDADGPYAGIITAVHQPTERDPQRCDLVTFGPHSMYHHCGVPFSETPTPLFWTWPPRV